MFYELRIYTLVPQQTQTYLDLLASPDGEFLAPMKQFLVGHFQSEIGPLNQVLALYRYESLEQRADARAQARQNVAASRYAHVPGQIRPLLQTMESRLMLPTSLSGLR